MEQYSPTDFFRGNASIFYQKFSSQILEGLNNQANLLSLSSPESDIYFGEEDNNNEFHYKGLKQVTKAIQKSDSKKRGYISTPNEIRLELIDAVYSHGEKIKHAARRLGIKYSSAKAICQIYRKEGRSDKIVLRGKKDKETDFDENQIQINLSTTIESKRQEFEERQDSLTKFDISNNKDPVLEARDQMLEPNITPWKEEGYTHDLPHKGSNENSHFSLSPIPHSRDCQQIKVSHQKTNEATLHNNTNPQPLYYFPHLQKNFNTMDTMDNLSLGIQPTYLPDQNTIVPFVFSNIQPQHSPVIGPFNPLGYQQHNLSYPHPSNHNFYPLQGNINFAHATPNNLFMSHNTPSVDYFHVYPMQHQQSNNPVNPPFYVMPNNINNLFLHFPQMAQNGQIYRTVYDPRISQPGLEYQIYENFAYGNSNKNHDNHQNPSSKIGK